MNNVFLSDQSVTIHNWLILYQEHSKMLSKIIMCEGPLVYINVRWEYNTNMMIIKSHCECQDKNIKNDERVIGGT